MTSALAAPPTPPGQRGVRLLSVIGVIAAIAVTAWICIPNPISRRAAIIGGATIVLWLSETVPPYVPTLALVAAVPLWLGPLDPAYGLGPVMGWAADPVLAMFFGGFALGAAAARHGVDAYVAGRAVALSRRRRHGLLALVMLTTASLSMWMSNIAAAAMMLASLRPHLDRAGHSGSFRRALLLGVAMAANLGGMSTPIGTGPNGIAVASLEATTPITFVQWMAFALPLMLGVLALGYVLIVRLYVVEGRDSVSDLPAASLQGRARSLVLLFAVAVAAWLTEPLHGVSAPVVGLVTAAVLFGGGWLGREDLGRLDWSTMFLIAGGLVLGKLAERSGMTGAISEAMNWNAIAPTITIVALVFLAAAMGAVMSNTASAAMLIPIALGMGLPPSTAVLIAIGTAFGVVFVISTPPNAMAYGEGDLRARDLLQVGLPLMLIGCLFVGLSGPAFLRWVGLR